MTIYKNSGLAVSMQSAIGSAKTLTAISVGASADFTGTHDFSAGDIVLIECEGMREVNNRLFQVLSVSTTVSFKVEAINGTDALDTSGYHAFTSGTAKKVTLGTTVSQVSEMTPSGGTPKKVDTTTIQDLVDTEAIVGASARSYALTMQWDPANPGQEAMQTAFETSTPKGFKVMWPSGRYALFYADVGFTGMPGGATQGVTTTQAELVLRGAPTFGM